jgi:hypothetical protein
MGCSILYSRPPTPLTEADPAPGETRRSNEDRCRGKYPLYDLTWVAGGISWVLLADSLEDTSRNPEINSQGQLTRGPPTQDYSTMRTLGWVQAGFFAGSTLWGAYVQGRCFSADRDARKQELERDQAARALHGEFPNHVMGFTLGMPAGQAESTCRGDGRLYSSDGAEATCSAHPSATMESNVRLQFRLGTLAEVTVYYLRSPEELAKTYDQLYEVLGKKYGTPHSDRGALSPECRANLGQCLEQGNTIKGAAWFWPKGSVTLAPIWRNEHAEIDVRYAINETD